MPYVRRGLGTSVQRWLTALAPWLIAAAVCWAFRGVCDAFFVQDDFWFLQAARAPVPNAMWWRGALPDYLRPLPYWFAFAGWHWFGAAPAGYHVLQLAAFAAAVAVLQRMLARLTGSPLAAAIGATAFGLSWIHITPLAWLSGTSDTLALLAAVLFLRAALGHARGRGAIPLVVPLCALALIAKEACAVLPLAVVGYVASRCFAARRRPTPRERRLVAALLSTLLVYVVAWAMLILPGHGSAFALDPTRIVHVLCDSLGALRPIRHRVPTTSPLWLVAPLVIAAVLPRRWRARAGLALLLWIAPAAVFGVTSKPIGLQPYYADFSLLGVALLAALAAAALLRAVPRARTALRIAMLALLVVWAAVAVRADARAVRAALAPPLHQARYSAAAHQAIRAALATGAFREVVLLDVRELMWWSIGKGAMVPALFGIPVRVDGYDGCAIPPGTATSADTLVLRQTGEMELAVVRA